jgi:uncharacterized repeat protein (TIGR01451 family)
MGSPQSGFVTLAIIGFVLLSLLPAVTPTARAALFTVTTTADDGAGSLREAITLANSTLGADEIRFTIPGAGPHTINLLSPLPIITDPDLLINGLSQPGASCAAWPPSLQIVINGASSSGAAFNIGMLTIDANNVTLRGLVLQGYQDGSGSAVTMRNSSGHVLECNFVGTDVSGTSAVANRTGVSMINVNSSYIGQNPGINDLVERNLISGQSGFSFNSPGVVMSGNDNRIAGNYIGTDVTGLLALPNDGTGVRVDNGTGNVIGGPVVADRNVLSGNNNAGLTLVGGTQTVINNYVGLGADGTTALGNGSVGITLIGGSGHTIGGILPSLSNVISSNGRSAFFDNAGIQINGSSNNQIVGNIIGLDASSLLARPNASGIVVRGSGSNDNTIRLNVISGNTRRGIDIFDQAARTQVQGNVIGTDVTGATIIPNSNNGILISNGAIDTLIGTNGDGVNDAQEANLIGGNIGHGILINRTYPSGVGDPVTGTIIAGNWIGVNPLTGTAVSNTTDGVRITNAAKTTRVGGNLPIEQNRIAFNRGNGVTLLGFNGNGGTINNQIINNHIYSNEQNGLLVDSTEAHTVAPGGTPGSNTIQANQIRTNTLAGIALIGASPNIIGNTIRENNGSGIRVEPYLGFPGSFGTSGPDNPDDDYLARPQIGGAGADQNSLENNCAGGTTDCAAIFLLDTTPTNDVALFSDNSFVAPTVPAIEQRWYGALEALVGTTPIDASSAVVSITATDSSVTPITQGGACGGALAGLILNGGIGFNCRDVRTWPQFVQYRIAADGTRTNITPHSVSAPPALNAVNYSFDADATTDPGADLGGFSGDGIVSGPFLRYQVIEVQVSGADLAISKTVDAATVIAGAAVNYTITATNNGPDPVSGAQIIDTFGADLTAVNWTCNATGGATCPVSSGSGDLDLLVDLPVSAVITINVAATISPTVSDTVSNTATINPPKGVLDADPNNNSATVSSALGVAADLTLSKVATPTRVAPGAEVTYTLTIGNNGPNPASSIVLSDTLPAGTSFVRATSTAGSCGEAAGTVTCTLGSTILLVDDDEGNTPDMRTFYTAALTALGYAYEIHDVDSAGVPTEAQLARYDLVIWFGGESGSLNDAEETVLDTYLSNGGRLFLSAQDYHFNRGSVTPFMTNRLGVSAITDDTGVSGALNGVGAFAGLGPYATTFSFSDYSDRITPTANATAVLQDSADPPAIGGIATNDGATVFFALPWEAIQNNNAANGQALLAQIVQYVRPGMSFSALAVGAMLEVEITLRMPSTTGEVMNSAQVQALQLDPNQPNTASATVVVAIPTPAYGSTPAPESQIDLGNALPGAPTSTTLSIREEGDALLIVSEPQFSGPDAAQFSLGDPAQFPLSITDGAAPVTVELICTPTVAGALSATLTFTTNDPARPSVQYDLVCAGLTPGAPAYGSTPAPSSQIDLGSALPGAPTSATLRIREEGDALLIVSEPQFSGPDAAQFSLGDPAQFPLSIADGAAPVTVELICTPSRAGALSATLTFTTNDPARPSVQYDLVCLGSTIVPSTTTLYLPLVARGLPDLVVTAINIVPAQAAYQAGESVTISITVKNQGSVPTTGPFWVDLYVNPSRSPQVNDLWHDLCAAAPCVGATWPVRMILQPGEEITLTTDSGIDPLRSFWLGWLPAGTSSIHVYADNWNITGERGTVIEQLETNNSRQLELTLVTGTNPAYEPWAPPSILRDANADLPSRPLLRDTVIR